MRGCHHILGYDDNAASVAFQKVTAGDWTKQV
jgi:hypothetical protein